MFVGHIGAGLVVKRWEPRLNLGLLLGATLFADLLLWVLVICGVESVGAPEIVGAGRFLTFVFPYSHGLVASLLWSALAAIAGWLFATPRTPQRARLAWALALAVFSHFVLDLIVHVPDLPVFGHGSSVLGLGLWRHMPLALALELAFAATALGISLQAVRHSRARACLLGGTLIVAAAFTAAGPYIPGDPPPAAVLGLSSLTALTVVVLLGFVVEGRVGAMAVRHRAPGRDRALRIERPLQPSSNRETPNRQDAKIAARKVIGGVGDNGRGDRTDTA